MKSGLRCRTKHAWGDRGATVVEYAMLVALIVVVSIGAITAIQGRGAQRLSASDDRITPAADGQYYSSGGTPSSVPPSTTTTVAGAIAVHVASPPLIVIESSSQSEWRVTVTFTLLDSSNNGVIGASMNGSWSDGGNGSAPGTTCSTSTSSGRCTLQFTAIKDNVNTVTFTLTSITGGSFFWQPANAGEGTLVLGCSPPLNSSCD